MERAASISSSSGTVASMPSGSTPPGNGPLGQSRRSGHEAAATASGSGSKGSGSSLSSESESSSFDFFSDDSSSSESESTIAVVSGASRLSTASRSFACAHSRLRRFRHHLFVSAGSRQTASSSSTGRSFSSGRPAAAPPRRTYHSSCASSKDARASASVSSSSVLTPRMSSTIRRSEILRDMISGATHGRRPSTSIASAGDAS